MQFNFREIATITTVLFAVIDVVGAIPVILQVKERSGAIKPLNITLISGGIMIVFLFLGQSLLDLIGIDIKSFAIAGAFILFFISLEMLLGIRINRDESTGTANVIPIAFPLIAGAGTMTTLLSLRSTYSLENILVAILINLFIVYVVLRNLYRLEALLGPGGISILRKAFGVVLLALAVKLFKSNF
jgi:multiple antibiotic resistance protein